MIKYYQIILFGEKNKFGFEAPTKSWVNSIEDEIIISISKSKILSEISDSINLNRLDLNQKWKLFNISKWEDIYKVSWREE